MNKETLATNYANSKMAITEENSHAEIISDAKSTWNVIYNAHVSGFESRDEEVAEWREECDRLNRLIEDIIKTGMNEACKLDKMSIDEVTDRTERAWQQFKTENNL